MFNDMRITNALPNDLYKCLIDCSDDGKFIISGSEDRCVYFWQTMPDTSEMAILAPLVNSLGLDGDKSESDQFSIKEKNNGGFLFPVLSHGRRDRNSEYESFEAHNDIVTCAIFAPTQINEHLEAAGLRKSDPEGRQRQPSVDVKVELGGSLDTVDDGKRSRGKMLDLLSRPKAIGNSLLPSSTALSTRRTNRPSDGRIILTADYKGCIRVYENERRDGEYYNVSSMHSSCSDLPDGAKTSSSND